MSMDNDVWLEQLLARVEGLRSDTLGNTKVDQEILASAVRKLDSLKILLQLAVSLAGDSDEQH